MEGCGLANMDLEFTKYLIGLFKQYYPYSLNYILIFEMAWILNGKVLQPWTRFMAADAELLIILCKQPWKHFFYFTTIGFLLPAIILSNNKQNIIVASNYATETQ